MNPDDDKFIVQAVRNALQAEVAKICDEEAKAAAARVEARVKGKVAEVTTTLFREMSFERVGAKLRIEVDFQNEQA